MKEKENQMHHCSRGSETLKMSRALPDFSKCGSVEYLDKLGIFTTVSLSFPLFILYLVLHYYDFSQRGLFFLEYDLICTLYQ